MSTNESGKRCTDVAIYTIYTDMHTYIFHQEGNKPTVQMTKFFFLTKHVYSPSCFYKEVT